MLCSKLHCQKGLNCILFLYKNSSRQGVLGNIREVSQKLQNLQGYLAYKKSALPLGIFSYERGTTVTLNTLPRRRTCSATSKRFWARQRSSGSSPPMTPL